MKEVFIVKHGVGGQIYIDTGKQPVDYRVEDREGGGWRFVVNIARTPEVEEILRLRLELNVFLFHSYEDAPTRKTWYYVNEGPVHYDEALSQLTIEAGSRIAYVPDEYLS